MTLEEAKARLWPDQVAAPAQVAEVVYSDEELAAMDAEADAEDQITEVHAEEFGGFDDEGPDDGPPDMDGPDDGPDNAPSN